MSLNEKIWMFAIVTAAVVVGGLVVAKVVSDQAKQQLSDASSSNPILKLLSKV